MIPVELGSGVVESFEMPGEKAGLVSGGEEGFEETETVEESAVGGLDGEGLGDFPVVASP